MSGLLSLVAVSENRTPISTPSVPSAPSVHSLTSSLPHLVFARKTRCGMLRMLC